LTSRLLVQSHLPSLEPAPAKEPVVIPTKDDYRKLFSVKIQD